MVWSAVRCAALAALLVPAALYVAPLGAQTLEDLDLLSDSAVTEEIGLQAARDMATRGEYLEALAMIERVLAVHPKSREGRLLHAIYLCRIDDRRGGLVEIGKLKKKDYGEQLLDEARALCRGQGDR